MASREEPPAELAQALIEQGLRRYGEGDLAQAISNWEKALTADAGAVRAREYVAYVRENFEVLAGHVHVAGVASARALGSADASDAHELIGIEQRAHDEPKASGDRAGENVDDGWELNEFVALTPPLKTEVVERAVDAGLLRRGR